MFSGCTSLTWVPVLPATTLVDDCYSYMFFYCPNIKSIKCLAANPSDTALESWVEYVSTTGTFTKLAGVDWPIGDSGIPSGWTVVEI